MEFKKFCCPNQRILRKWQRDFFLKGSLSLLLVFYIIREFFYQQSLKIQQKEFNTVLCLQNYQVYVPFEANGIVLKPELRPKEWLIYASTTQNNTINDQRIFFHETSGKSDLSLRQCCAVESAARHNSNRPVQLFIRSSACCMANLDQPSRVLSWKKLPWLKILSLYNNVEVVLLNEDHYFSGTPLESWYRKAVWRTSPFEIGHLSDYIRILSLYKEGGMYLDMDVLTLKTFHGTMFQNYFVYENEAMDTIGNSIIQLRWGHHLINELMRLLSEEYDPEAYVYHGPDAIADVMNRVCSLVAGNPKSNKCSDIKVLPHRYFHPVAAMFSHMLFQNNSKQVEVELLSEIKRSFGLHLWNSISSREPVNINSNQIFALLAREHCPLTASRMADFVSL